MFKKIVFAVIFSVSVFAGDIKWYKYQEIKSMKRDKPVFVFASSTRCKYCKKELKLMNSNEKFKEYIQKNFIPVYIYQDREFVPDFFSPTTPTFFIADDKDIQLIAPVRGAVPLDKLVKYMNKALYKYNERKGQED